MTPDERAKFYKLECKVYELSEMNETLKRRISNLMLENAMLRGENEGFREAIKLPKMKATDYCHLKIVQ